MGRARMPRIVRLIAMMLGGAICGATILSEALYAYFYNGRSLGERQARILILGTVIGALLGLAGEFLWRLASHAPRRWRFSVYELLLGITLVVVAMATVVRLVQWAESPI